MSQSLNRVTNGARWVSIVRVRESRVDSSPDSLDSQAAYVEAIAKILKQAQFLGELTVCHSFAVQDC